MASSFNYGNMKSQGPGQDLPDWALNGGAHQLQTKGVGYQTPINMLRQDSGTSSINTLSNLSQPDRINTLANRQYEQLAARQQAGNLLYQQNWTTGLNNLNNLGDTARNAVFDSWRNMGLLNGPSGSPYSYNNGGIPGSWTSQNAQGSLENQFAAYNQGIFGAANSAALRSYGINPGTIQTAYNRLMGQTY
jgi:hypothetical protein